MIFYFDFSLSLFSVSEHKKETEHTDVHDPLSSSLFSVRERVSNLKSRNIDNEEQIINHGNKFHSNKCETFDNRLNLLASNDNVVSNEEKDKSTLNYNNGILKNKFELKNVINNIWNDSDSEDNGNEVSDSCRIKIF